MVDFMRVIWQGVFSEATTQFHGDELRHLAGPDMIVCRSKDVPAGALLRWCSWLHAKPPDPLRDGALFGADLRGVDCIP
jgi:hypothetical protein